MVNVAEKSNKQQNDIEEAQSRISIREGYLPVPILIIEPALLADKHLYIADADRNLKKYLKEDHEYNSSHKDFLLKKGVRYLYLSISDFNEYLKAVCRHAEDIVTTKDLPIAEKCEFAYAVLLALAYRIMNIEITRNTFVEAMKICKSITPIFVDNSHIYKHFSNTMRHEYDHAVHNANMSVTLTAFAQKIGIQDEKILTHCCCGGILHDIGKRFIPDDVLNSTEKLTELDLMVAQNHVKEGIKIIEQHSKMPTRVMNIISEHHETVDGEGYPKGLCNKDISIFGKMACIVDMFDAMTSERPYRKDVMTTEQAIKEIRGLVGLKLDKTIAGSFAQFIDGEIRGVPISDDYYDGMILDDLGLTPEIGANPSGRRHERYYFRTKVRISKLSRKDDKWILTDPKFMYCSNMSVSGLAMLYDRKQDLNQMVRIELEMPEEYEEKVQAIGKIVRCIDNGGGMYTIGVEFLKYIEEDKIKEIYELLK